MYIVLQVNWILITMIFRYVDKILLFKSSFCELFYDVCRTVASVDKAFGWGKMQSSFCSNSGYSCGNLAGRFIFSLLCVTIDG